MGDVTATQDPLAREAGSSMQHPPVVDEQQHAGVQLEPEAVGGVAHHLRQFVVVGVELLHLVRGDRIQWGHVVRVES